jgi:hypothetical protein
MPDAIFSRFSHAFWMELRLLVRNWFYPIMHVLWAALLIVMFFDHDAGITLLSTLRDSRSAQAQLETTLGRFSIGMVSLIAIFIAGISASRARRTRFAWLEDSFPAGAEIPLARWLATLLALAAFLVQPLLIAAYQGPPASLLAGLPLFVFEGVLTIAFTAAFAWWLASLLKMGRWSYPLLAAVWMGFMAGPTILGLRFGAVGQLLNFMRQGVSFYSEMWGRTPYAGLENLFNLFYLGLLALLLILLLLVIVQRRFFRIPVMGVAAALLALALTVYGGSAYIRLFDHQVLQMNAGISSYLNLDGPAWESELAVERYDLILDLTDSDYPTFSAHLLVVNPGSVPLETLDLALMPALKVTDASLPYEQQAGRLRFSLPQPLQPGDMLDLQVNYAGPVRRVNVYERVPQWEDFIHLDGVRLSPGTIWYPQPVSGAGEAVYHVEVVGAGMPFASNLPAVGDYEFASEAATWVFLIASPHLVTHDEGAVRLVTARNDLELVEEYAVIYADLLPQVQAFFPQVQVDQAILMVLGEENGMPENTPPSFGAPLVISSPWVLNWLKEEDYGRYRMGFLPLFYDFWSLAGGNVDAESKIQLDELARFLWTRSRVGVDIESIDAAYDTHITGFEERLLSVFALEGDEGLRKLLDELVERSGEGKLAAPEDWNAWLEEVSVEN